MTNRISSIKRHDQVIQKPHCGSYSPDSEPHFVHPHQYPHHPRGCFWSTPPCLGPPGCRSHRRLGRIRVRREGREEVARSRARGTPRKTGVHDDGRESRGPTSMDARNHWVVEENHRKRPPNGRSKSVTSPPPVRVGPHGTTGSPRFTTGQVLDSMGLSGQEGCFGC